MGRGAGLGWRHFEGGGCAAPDPKSSHFCALTGKLRCVPRATACRFALSPMVVNGKASSALRLFDRLLGGNSCDRFFQDTVSFFSRLRLKRAGRSAITPLDVVAQRLPALVFS